MKARLVKALLPYHFPHADYSIWVDSKLQMNRDPLLLIHRHLHQPGADVAVSENHVRDNVFDEADKLAKMFHGGAVQARSWLESTRFQSLIVKMMTVL